MSLFRKELWDLRWRVLILLVLTLLTGYFVLAYHEWFKAMADISQIEQGLKQAPFLEKFLDMETLKQELVDLFNNVDFYVWSQWFGKNLYQLILLAIIVLTFPLFTRETEQDTNHFLLSNRTREEIFLTKVLAGFLSLLLIIVVGSILPVIIGPLYGFDFGLEKALMYTLHLVLTSFFLYSGVVFFSIISRDVIKAILASIVLFIILGLAGKLPSMQNFNIFRYMKGIDVYFTGTVQASAMLIILLMGVLILYGSWQIYKRKDF